MSWEIQPNIFVIALFVFAFPAFAQVAKNSNSGMRLGV